MRQAAATVAVGMLASTIAVAAQAQQLVLADGSRYASVAEYYSGTWKWERPQPRQTAITRFGRDGSFFFHNLTNGVQHIGRYTAGATVTVTLVKSCRDNGASCQTHEPPAVKDYPFKPVSADLFQAGVEQWERQKSNLRPSM